LGWSYTEESPVDNEQKAMIAAILAIGNDSRGGDSWGFYSFENMVKGLGDMSNHAKMLLNSNRLIGHTRKATTGSICTQNSHPFEIGDVIGAHNGIITNHNEISKKYNRSFEVDSMHIFANLDEGIDLKELSGYGSIVWTRKSDPNKIYLCKLSGGDLSIRGIGTGPDDVCGILWSSDESHLEQAVNTAGLDTFEYKVETGQVYFVKNGDLYKEDMELEFQSRYSSNMPNWRHGWLMDDDFDDWKSSYSRMLKSDEKSDSDKSDKSDKKPDRSSGFLSAAEKHEADLERLEDVWKLFKGESNDDFDDAATSSDLDELEFIDGLGWIKSNEDGTATLIKSDE
jgi:hypothetical protein